MLPWLLGGALLLLAGLGTVLVLLLGRDDGGIAPTARPAPATTEAPTDEPSEPSARAPRATAADLPGGARDPDPAPEKSGRYAGSGDAALAWVEAMGRRDFRAAYDLSCGELQDAAVTAAAGGDPAVTLGDYFYADTLGGQTFTSGTFHSVEYQANSRTDLASFTLELADGRSLVLSVHVGRDHTVCDFY